MAEAVQTAKSGLKVLKTGDVLFNDGEHAESLFIIQKGQLRLYKPKGKGFIEIAVLRSGEVIGEMAYFDVDGGGNKRSCSAAAMVPTEVIEISFTAFGKTMNSLNPWFKTIINTLATRLRKTNNKLKELESNSTSLSYGQGKVASYEFMKSNDVIKALGTIFLVFKSHGEQDDLGFSLHRKTLDLYATDVYGISEAKLDAIIFSLRDLNWLEINEDQDKTPNLYTMKNLELIRSLFIFYNTEKHLPDDKRMKISQNCQTFLEKILQYLPNNPVEDIPNIKKPDEFEKRTVKYTQRYNLTPILEEFKNRNILINPDHLEDARSISVTGEVMMFNGKVMVEIDIAKLQKMYPVIKFVNLILKANREKSGES